MSRRVGLEIGRASAPVAQAMKRSFQVVRCVALMGLAGAVGCGDDDGNGGEKLNDLSAAEAEDLCEWVKEHNNIGGTERQWCTVDAVSETSSKTSCDAYVEDCLDNGDYADLSDDTDCSDFDVEDELGSDCSATVSQLKSCVNALVAQQKKALSNASCSDAGEDLYSEFPASCEKVEEDCPSFFED